MEFLGELVGQNGALTDSALETVLHSVVRPWTAEDNSDLPLNFALTGEADSWLLASAPGLSSWEVKEVLSTQPILAQQFDQDVLGDMGNAWNTFVQSGQIWALIIGLVLGYLIRGLTTY
ncbi:MAG TPA: hypothetical protein V6D06_17480 [Trichocoleus sp.]